jgi:hypothetical protein
MEERFWSKVNKTDTCWLWTATLDRYGYGQFYCNGRMVASHRLSWLLSGNTIPEGMVTCHAPHEICGNRHCVNPAHLKADSYSENNKDAYRDGTRPSKLTEEQVRAIRANLKNKSQRGLAREYGVSQGLISDIISRKRWSWLN